MITLLLLVTLHSKIFSEKWFPCDVRFRVEMMLGLCDDPVSQAVVLCGR